MQPTFGNEVNPLINGDEAYPIMIEAIERSKYVVAMSSYQFDSDAVGCEFVSALKRARQRGVEVRVVVDWLGIQLTRSSITTSFREASISFAVFNPAFRIRQINSRYHRKLLIIDNSMAFTGGLNIRRDHLLSAGPARPTEDLHFMMRGPLVAQLLDVFREDWDSLTGQLFAIPDFKTVQAQVGMVAARVIVSEPKSVGGIRLRLVQELQLARSFIRIVSPYFIPDDDFVSVLIEAAKRGVVVEILLSMRAPGWARLASASILIRLVKAGCSVTWSLGHFDHSKLILVALRESWWAIA